MPGCCAITVFKNFGTAAHQTKDYTEEEIDKFLKNELKYSIKEEDSIVQANLNHVQYKLFKNIFLKHGFKLVIRNYHPPFKSYIYILLKRITHEKV
jgi:hypothetical protein